jgi:hypothetical protein
MNKPQRIDRRKYPRIPADAVMGIHRLDGGTQLAQSVDLGLGGIRFQCAGLEVDPGDIIEVTFTLGETSATVAGKVIRLNELDLLAQEAALTFVKVDPETLQRLYELGLSGGEDDPEE